MGSVSDKNISRLKYAVKRDFFKLLIVALLFIHLLWIEYRFFVIGNQTGNYPKFFCSEAKTSNKLKSSVVRVVGGVSEGSGFFIEPNKVVTNYHVVSEELSPKIIFPDGHLTTPVHITANEEADLAILEIDESHPEMVLNSISVDTLKDNEVVFAAGYPLGHEITGEATVVKGNYSTVRDDVSSPIQYIQTTTTLVLGMSGGPTVDKCSNLIGINTISLSGLSLNVTSNSLRERLNNFSQDPIRKVNHDPANSPIEAVRAYYQHLTNHDTNSAFNLLSDQNPKKVDISTWSQQYSGILDIYIEQINIAPGNSDTVLIRYFIKNWVDEKVFYDLYEGSWETIFEDGLYKLRSENIEKINTVEIEDIIPSVSPTIFIQ